MSICTWRSPEFLQRHFRLVEEVRGGSGCFLVEKKSTLKAYELRQFQMTIESNDEVEMTDEVAQECLDLLMPHHALVKTLEGVFSAEERGGGSTPVRPTPSPLRVRCPIQRIIDTWVCMDEGPSGGGDRTATLNVILEHIPYTMESLGGLKRQMGVRDEDGDIPSDRASLWTGRETREMLWACSKTIAALDSLLSASDRPAEDGFPVLSLDQTTVGCRCGDGSLHADEFKVLVDAVRHIALKTAAPAIQSVKDRYPIDVWGHLNFHQGPRASMFFLGILLLDMMLVVSPGTIDTESDAWRHLMSSSVSARAQSAPLPPGVLPYIGRTFAIAPAAPPPSRGSDSGRGPRPPSRPWVCSTDEQVMVFMRATLAQLLQRESSLAEHPQQLSKMLESRSLASSLQNSRTPSRGTAAGSVPIPSAPPTAGSYMPVVKENYGPTLFTAVVLHEKGNVKLGRDFTRMLRVTNFEREKKNIMATQLSEAWSMTRPEPTTSLPPITGVHNWYYPVKIPSSPRR